jgi:hypothetical protein
MNPDSKQAKKVPYKAPKLRVYGNLAQMTQSGTSMGMVIDGGVPGQSKTG